MNFNGEDLGFFLRQMLGGALGLNYIAPDNLPGTVTFQSEAPLPKGQVLQIVRDILAKNGLILKQISGIYHVGSREVISGLEGMAAEGRGSELTTRIIRFPKGDPAKLVAVVKTIVPNAMIMEPSPGSSTLLVRGTPADVAQVEDLLSTLSATGVATNKIAIVPVLESPPNAWPSRSRSSMPPSSVKQPAASRSFRWKTSRRCSLAPRMRS